MSKITGSFWVWKCPKIKNFQATLYPAAGLPPEVRIKWNKYSFYEYLFLAGSWG
jgi:hypothetical protein